MSSDPRIPWDFSFPDQTCAHCRLEHPGEVCGLESLAQPLPLDDTHQPPHTTNHTHHREN